MSGEAAIAENISLPQLKDKRTIRRSKSARWRAAVLIAVHVLIAIHIAQWLSTGSTMSPLEPSEAMEFSKHSIINAGLIFFALAILSTLILGRWFCGWGCHVVALQDLSRWILGKLRIKPKPARLGCLALVPLAAFLYMFIAPLIYRLMSDDGPAVGQTHLSTQTFWATFPPLVPAILTFVVCGGVIIYLLGAKGFCTYGCPYGAIFGIADQLSPWRIRVTDACEGCGHCTAVCSSNVRVHQEVRDHRMVVDPGCMKCFDCVSVCPNDALYFGVGAPAFLTRTASRSASQSAKHIAGADSWAQWLLPAVFLFASMTLFMWYDSPVNWWLALILTALGVLLFAAFKGSSQRIQEYSLAEQCLLCALFLVAMLAFRGLYGMVPFLFSLGLSAISAYLCVVALRLVYKSNLTLHGFRLKSAGRLRRAGHIFIVLLTVVVGVAAHSAALQYHTRNAKVLYQLAVSKRLGGEGHADAFDDRTAERALQHARAVCELSLLANPYDQVRLARAYYLNGDADRYGKLLTEASEALPDDAQLPLELADYYASQQRTQSAVEAYSESIRRQPDQVNAYVGLAKLSAATGQLPRAIAAYKEAIAHNPNNPRLPYECGTLVSMTGDLPQAIEWLNRAVQLDPDFIEARENLAGAYCQNGQFQEGIKHFEIALAQQGEDIVTLQLLSRAHLALGEQAKAIEYLERALRIDPQLPGVAELLEQLQQTDVSASESLSVQQEVIGNILHQPVGGHTLEAFALPAKFVSRIADRIICASYRQHYYGVQPEEPVIEWHAADIAPAFAAHIEVLRQDSPGGVLEYRRSLPEDRPALPGFRAPILERTASIEPMVLDDACSEVQRRAAQFVGDRLATDGLLPTLVRVIELIGPRTLAAADDHGLNLLRLTGLPVDLLACFDQAGSADEAVVAIVQAVLQRFDACEDADTIIEQLHLRPFVFRKSNASYSVATESGEQDIGTLRLQLTRGTYWRGVGAGGALDVARQLLQHNPDVEVLASIEEQHVEPLLALVSTWEPESISKLQLLAEPLVVAQWAADNGKAGYIVRADGIRAPATLTPRYASRREDGSQFIPNESFVMDQLAATGHIVIQSPLLFQGGDLLAVRDPATGERLLLVGEAEIYRNTALGLSAAQVLEAFCAEFNVDRCVVLPSVSFHIDYDVSIRAHDGELVALVNDTEAAVVQILDLGLDALAAAGVLTSGQAVNARALLAGGRHEEFLQMLTPAVMQQRDTEGAFPLLLAQHFSSGDMDPGTPNLQRFLVAMDILRAMTLDLDALSVDPYTLSCLRAIKNREQDRAELHELLAEAGMRVVGVPSLAEAEYSVNHINGIHDRSRFLMPAYGGFYQPLDDAAAAAIAAALAGVRVVPILCAESQRRVGAVHCSVAVYPRFE